MSPARSAPWLLAVGWLLVAGCSLIDANQPARYLCLRDGGAADQCPGGWRCGYAGFCLDPEVPGTYACGADPDCVGGWACGLDGTCLDPAAPRAFRCLTDHDCAGGWHCGVLQLCYDRALATDVACRAAVPLDCAPGWRCGLEQKCHDTDAGAPYACLTDADCEKGWRCGPDAVCLDASEDALRPTDGLPVPTARLLEPAFPGGLADRAATAQQAPTQVCDAGVSTVVDVTLTGDRLTRLERYLSSLSGGRPTDCPAGVVQPETPLAWAARFQVQLPFSGGRALLVDGPDTWVVQPDGGLLVATVDRAAGTLRTRARPVPVDTTAVRTGPAEHPLVAVGGRAVAVGLADGGWDLPPLLPLTAGPAASGIAGYGLQSLPDGLQVFTDRTLCLLGVDAGASFSQRSTADWACAGTVCQWTCADGGVPRQVGFFSGGAGIPSQVLEDCADPGDGLSGLESVVVGGSCNLILRTVHPFTTEGPLWAPLRVEGGAQSSLVLTNQVGAFWLNPLSPEVLSGVPTATLGSVDQPLAATAEDFTPIGAAPASAYLATDAGFVTIALSPRLRGLLSGIDGRPTWGLFSATGLVLQAVDTHGDPFFGYRGALDVRAASPGFIDTSASVVSAAASPPSDAGSILLVSVDDALHAAELAPDGGAPGTLRVVLVPQVRASITHLLALPPAPGASHANGYLIASGRVYRVRADNPVVWLADEVRLGSAEAVALWKDGTRVRVGYRDGSVWGLPSGTLLAPPLAAQASTAVDFAGVCGRSFLATTGGLYELVAGPGAAVGQWRAVPLAATGVRARPPGRLQTDGRGLLVYRQQGVVERLEGLTCLP